MKITFRLILAAYTAVAMNSFLPANIGTGDAGHVHDRIAGATFTAMLGITVQKIPFSVFNIAVISSLHLGRGVVLDQAQRARDHCSR